MVGGKYDHGIVQQTLLPKRVDDGPNFMVNLLNQASVVGANLLFVRVIKLGVVNAVPAAFVDVYVLLA